MITVEKSVSALKMEITRLEKMGHGIDTDAAIAALKWILIGTEEPSKSIQRERDQSVEVGIALYERYASGATDQ